MMTMVLKLKIHATLREARFHFFKPSLGRNLAADRLVTLVEEYAKDQIKDDRDKHKRQDSVVLPELLSTIEEILLERENNEMSDDMITISNIEIAVQDARSKITPEEAL